MEPDSSLDFVVDDLPGIGRSYQMTGTNGGRITVVVPARTPTGQERRHAVHVVATPERAIEALARSAPGASHQPGPCRRAAPPGRLHRTRSAAGLHVAVPTSFGVTDHAVRRRGGREWTQPTS
jgi:hypothetical protein